MDLSSHFFIRSSVDCYSCPDQESDPRPRCVGVTLSPTELSSQGLSARSTSRCHPTPSLTLGRHGHSSTSPSEHTVISLWRALAFLWRLSRSIVCSFMSHWAICFRGMLCLLVGVFLFLLIHSFNLFYKYSEYTPFRVICIANIHSFPLASILLVLPFDE